MANKTQTQKLNSIKSSIKELGKMLNKEMKLLYTNGMSYEEIFIFIKENKIKAHREVEYLYNI